MMFAVFACMGIWKDVFFVWYGYAVRDDAQKAVDTYVRKSYNCITEQAFFGGTALCFSENTAF